MGTPFLWLVFNLFVLAVLALDLGVFNRRAHRVTMKEAAAWSAVCIALALVFAAGILHWHGRAPAVEFLTGYVVEESLSVDNLFIFVLLFRYFDVEPTYQHRVLFWGILGALVTRGAMVGLGAALIHRFSWILYVFGAFIVYAGVRLLFRKASDIHPERNLLTRWVTKLIPLSRQSEGEQFFVHQSGRWLATPLFLVLVVLEATDLVFAVDSIPAVFGVTRDPFIVYSSNVFAILGLRAMYFLLAGALDYLRYLDEGLAIVLTFIGAKMLVAPWFEIPTDVALIVVAGVLVVTVLASLVATRRAGKEQPTTRATVRTELRERPATELIAQLSDAEARQRASAANALFMSGTMLAGSATRSWLADAELSRLFVREQNDSASSMNRKVATVGIAVQPERFQSIRAANGSPPLADVPPDQDAQEFELDFDNGVRLDILTTRAPDGDGAIAKFLEKFGEGIQQVEYEVMDVDCATAILRERFKVQPIYPATRLGANRTRVNFFLVGTPHGEKVLVELVEAAIRQPG